MLFVGFYRLEREADKHPPDSAVIREPLLETRLLFGAPNEIKRGLILVSRRASHA
jgi:hypothetical protein